ncbi:MAG: ribosome-associated translation inhibitor RaiA [Bacteroidia bacterium]|nr:ribosome-associated translation inhibitor RaiA [Bacteroidia bacterium]
MNINIQSVHFDADRKLTAFIEEKVKKLDTFYDQIISADITLKLDKSSTSDNKIAEIRLSIPGNDLFAKRQCKTFEEAVDQAVSALKAQTKRHKEKQRQL